MIQHRDGEQLVLELGMPWDGISPRYLTRAPRRLSLASDGASRPIQDALGLQLELFPEGTSFSAVSREVA